MELERTNGARVKLILEIEGEAPEEVDESEISVVRDNAKQLERFPIILHHIRRRQSS